MFRLLGAYDHFDKLLSYGDNGNIDHIHFGDIEQFPLKGELLASLCLEQNLFGATVRHDFSPLKNNDPVCQTVDLTGVMADHESGRTEDPVQ